MSANEWNLEKPGGITDAMVDAELARNERREQRRLSVPIGVFWTLAGLGLIFAVSGLFSSDSDAGTVTVGGFGTAVSGYAVASILNALRSVRNAIVDQG